MRAQGSGVLTSMLAANGLAIIAEGRNGVAAGEEIDTLLIGAIATG
jgi:molybdopterin biosynthesis enzyme